MLTFITVIHVALSFIMTFVILLQPGKDAGMGTAFGGGAATTAFGGRGAVTFLTKVTAVCAALFFMTSLGLSFVGLKSSVAASGSIASQAKPINPNPVPPATAAQTKVTVPAPAKAPAPAPATK